jgi:hypothetical protein
MAERLHTIPDVATAVTAVTAESSLALQGPSWDAEDAYWQSAYRERTYARADRGYEYYRAAYRYGAENAARRPGQEWNDAERALRRGWVAAEDGSRTWEEVKDAIRDAWDHVRGHSDDDRTHIR